MKKETIYLSLAMLAITNIPCNAQSEEIKDSTLHLEEVTISTTRMPEIKQNAAAPVLKIVPLTFSIIYHSSLVYHLHM